LLPSWDQLPNRVQKIGLKQGTVTLQVAVNRISHNQRISEVREDRSCSGEKTRRCTSLAACPNGLISLVRLATAMPQAPAAAGEVAGTGGGATETSRALSRSSSEAGNSLSKANKHRTNLLYLDVLPSGTEVERATCEGASLVA
jgi:hypothetical protein